MTDEMTPEQEAAARDGFTLNPLAVMYANAYDACKEMWAGRVAAYVASVQRQVAQFRAEHNLSADAPVTVRPDATMRDHVMAAFAFDPTVTVADPS